MKIILYISHYNTIGGIERWLLNFAKRFLEITVLYDGGNCPIGERINWRKHYFCDIFINASVWNRQAFNIIEAKAYIQMIHGDYKAIRVYNNFQYKKHTKVTHHICVSEQAKKGFEEVTPHKCDAVMYNFVDSELTPLPKPKNDILKLVTVSRISKEKGFERMAEFEKKLIQKGIDFEWDIFGDTSTRYYSKIRPLFAKAKFRGVTKTPHTEIVKADYLVQLSDTEGYSCTINEALQMQTPVLLTPFPSGFEQIENGVNGYFIPFDLENIDFDTLLSSIPKLKKYKEKTSEKDWLNFFKFVLSKFYKDNKMVKVRVIGECQYEIGSIIEISEERAAYGIDNGLCEVYIEITNKSKKAELNKEDDDLLGPPLKKFK